MNVSSRSVAAALLRSGGRALLRVVDTFVPRFEDLGPAALSAAVGLVPLLGLRVWIALAHSPAASGVDLWRVLGGEVECWSIIAFVGALLLRHAPARVRRPLRVGLQGFTSVLLLASMVELVFFHVTGGRVDWEVLAFAWEDAPQVAPVFMSEVKPAHLAMLLGALAVGLSPVLVRFAPRGPGFGRYAFVLLLPVLFLEVDGRPRPRKELRALTPSLIEQLWWDGVERVGDYTIPPSAEELAPIQLVRVHERPPFNVVMIVLESVGARATTVYRPELGTTPNLLALADKGWVVDRAFAVVPHTSKALVTTMCGTWPQLRSEIREAQVGGLPDRCLPALLSELGYRTAFFQTAYEGFEARGALVHALGFDLFRSRDTLRGPAFEKVNYFGIDERAMIEPGLAWSQQDDRPFFATYLTLSSHHDYGTPSTWPSADFEGVSARQSKHYDAVHYVDDFVGRLVRAYEAAGLADNTLFVIFGDHGEAFDEHGRSMHDLVIYDEGLRIPMVLYGPGVLDGTGTITGDRQQIDVLPTLLDLLGVRAEGGSLPGESLFSEQAPARSLMHSCWRSHRCLARRTGPHKIMDLYRDGPMALYDLAVDPGEKTDLLATLPRGAAALARDELHAWRARVNGRYDAVRDRAIAALQTPDDSPALASWGGKLDLLGCTLEAQEVLPAEAVWVRCRWRAREHLKQAWRLDVRLDGGFDPVVANVTPLDGVFPTFKWTAGLAVEDTVRVFVPVDAAPGPATVSIGWERYGDRSIAMSGGGARYVVGTVEVLPALHPMDSTPDSAPIDVPSEDPGE